MFGNFCLDVAMDHHSPRLTEALAGCNNRFVSVDPRDLVSEHNHLLTGGKQMLLPSSKRGRRRTQENYWAVRLTSIPGEVMEDNILEVIKQHVKDKKVIGSSQHGLTKGESYLANLTAFCDGKAGWIDEGRAVVVVFLAFSKAFDIASFQP